MSRREDAGDPEGVRSLRRVERLALAWTVIGAGLFLGAGRPAGALVLTLAALASIVAFRGLQRVVYALGPATESTRRSFWRQGLLALVRVLFLGGVAAAAFLLAPNEFLGLIAGFTTLPAALMSEGALQMVRALCEGRSRNDDEHG